MRRTDYRARLLSGGEQRAAHAKAGPARKTARALMNGGHGFIGKHFNRAAGFRQVRGDIPSRMISLEGFHAAASDNTGSERLSGVLKQLVDERGLPPRVKRLPAWGLSRPAGAGVMSSVRRLELRLIRLLMPAARGTRNPTEVSSWNISIRLGSCS
jgi:hypothetical protein